MSKALSYAAYDRTSPFRPFSLDRREPGPQDVQIDILFCGVCHSDLHTARSEWPGTVYPCVPGHEIVGRVTKVGSDVTGFKVGDLAAVGCMVDSCRTCASCRAGLEQYCDNNDITFTYNAPDKKQPGSHDLRRLLQPDRRRRAFLPPPADRRWTWPPPRRCCAPASPPTRR